MTILFADIVGSTSLAEGMDPEAYRALVGSHFVKLQETIESFGGTVEKFIGDAVMAVFGVPVAHEDDPMRAVCAASAIQESFEGEPGPIAMRVAVNTGEVITSAGSEGRTGVVGDPVNTAARLEKLAPAGGIVIGDGTFRFVRDRISYEPLGPVELAGKVQPTDAYLVVAVESAAPDRPTYDAPMIGRELELDTLQRALERVTRARTCMLATILGPAGIGKSRLTSELVTRVDDAPRVLHGRCLPYGNGITFWPVTETIAEAAQISDRDPAGDAIKKVRALLGPDEDSRLVADLLSQLLGLTDSTASQEEIFWAIRRFYETLAAQGPLVLVWDDIHWAESTFLDLVDHIVENVAEVPLFVLCIARPELLEARPTWGGGKPNALTMLLDPLGEGETKELFARLIGDTPGAEALGAAILEAAEGNPYFLEQTIAMLGEEGVIEEVDGRWEVRRDVSGIAIPPTIHALLTTRLDHLSPQQRTTLEIAALMGKVFSARALRDLSAPGIDVRATLDELARKGILRIDQEQFAGDDMFRFRHLLMRDAAYFGLPKQRRAELHERYADWLVEVLGSRTSEYEEIIGYHFEQALAYAAEFGQAADPALLTRAGNTLGRAARRAASRDDTSAAIKLFTRALQLLPPGDPEAPYLMLDLAEVLVDDGDFVTGEQVLTETIAAARARGDAVVEERARLALEECLIHTSMKTAAEARTAAERSIERFTELGDHTGLAKAWRLLSYAFDTIGRSSDSQEAMGRAVHHAGLSGDEGDERFYRRVQIRSLSWSPLPMSEIESATTDFLTWTKEHGDRKGEALALGILATVEAAAGRFEPAREMLAKQRRIYDDLGLDLARAWGVFEVATVERSAGALDRAEDELRWSCEILQKKDEKAVLPTVMAVLADVRCSQGDLEEAVQLIDQADRLGVEDDLLTQIKCRSVRARIAARQGRCEEALTMAREAIAISEETEYLDWRAQAWVDLAEVADTCGHVSDASEAREEALALFDMKGMTARSEELREQVSGAHI